MGVLLIEYTFYAIGPESVVCFFSDMVHDAERQILKNVEQKTASWSPAKSVWNRKQKTLLLWAEWHSKYWNSVTQNSGKVGRNWTLTESNSSEYSNMKLPGFCSIQKQIRQSFCETVHNHAQSIHVFVGLVCLVLFTGPLQQSVSFKGWRWTLGPLTVNCRVGVYLLLVVNYVS